MAAWEVSPHRRSGAFWALFQLETRQSGVGGNGGFIFSTQGRMEIGHKEKCYEDHHHKLPQWGCHGWCICLQRQQNHLKPVWRSVHNASDTPTHRETIYDTIRLTSFAWLASFTKFNTDVIWISFQIVLFIRTRKRVGSMGLNVLWQLFTTFTIFDNFDNFWFFLDNNGQFLTILKFFNNLDNWQFWQFLQFWQWCDLIIKSDTEQHWQFLRCFFFTDFELQLIKSCFRRRIQFVPLNIKEEMLYELASHKF